MSTNNNKRILHRKEWQFMTPAVSSSSAGVIFIGDDSARNRFTLQVVSTTVQFLYDHEEDAWIQLPSAAFAGTFGGGTTGQYFPWSIDMRATSGTTTTITGSASSYNLTRFIKGQKLEFTAGTNAGLTANIVDLFCDAVNWTITLDTTLPNAVTTEWFRISSGRFFVLSAYLTLAAGVWKFFDIATMAWSGVAGTSLPTNLFTTGLPASWGTDGAMTTAYQLDNPFIVGTATSGSVNTLVDSTASWTPSNFINYQVKIIGATGIGQVRKITANTSNTLTVVPNWVTNPTAGSSYIIEASEELYLSGNNAAPFYKYTIASTFSGATESWTALTSAPAVLQAGSTLDAIVGATESVWKNPTNFFNGRYIYAFRGAGNTTLYRYDIPTNAWITYGSGGIANYGPLLETFSTGTSAMANGSRIYIRKDATNRFFYYDVIGNDLVPFSTNLYTDGTGVIGQKIWIKKYDDQTMWLYSIRNSDVILHRIMMF